MAQSKAVTVDQYLAELPEDRRETIRTVRELVRKNLPEGYEEMVSFGMICWGIPLSRYPETYNGQPLGYAALAAQKNYNALYLTAAYGDPEQEAVLADAYARAGKKLDMGKTCLRFKQLDDLVPDAVATVIASTPPDALIEKYEESRKLTKAGAKATGSKATASKAAASSKPAASSKKKPAAKKPARRG